MHKKTIYTNERLYYCVIIIPFVAIATHSMTLNMFSGNILNHWACASTEVVMGNYSNSDVMDRVRNQETQSESYEVKQTNLL